MTVTDEIRARCEPGVWYSDGNIDFYLKYLMQEKLSMFFAPKEYKNVCESVSKININEHCSVGVVYFLQIQPTNTVYFLQKQHTNKQTSLQHITGTSVQLLLFHATY